MDTDSSATDTTEAMTVETPDEEEEDTGYANVHTNSNCTTDAFEEQEMKEEPQPVQKKRRYSRNNNVWMTRVNRKKRRTAPKATPVAKSPESPKTDQQDGEEYEVETIVDHKVEDVSPGSLVLSSSIRVWLGISPVDSHSSHFLSPTWTRYLSLLSHPP